jgi:hypothetical protein
VAKDVLNPRLDIRNSSARRRSLLPREELPGMFFFKAREDGCGDHWIAEDLVLRGENAAQAYPERTIEFKLD